MDSSSVDVAVVAPFVAATAVVAGATAVAAGEPNGGRRRLEALTSLSLSLCFLPLFPLLASLAPARLSSPRLPLPFRCPRPCLLPRPHPPGPPPFPSSPATPLPCSSSPPPPPPPFPPPDPCLLFFWEDGSHVMVD